MREEFLGFVELTKTDAKSIADSILACMRQWGLDITKLRGQGYDGASIMFREYKQEYEKCAQMLYTYTVDHTI